MMTIQRLRILYVELIKILSHLDPSFMTNIFELKTSGRPNRSYQLS